MHTIHYMICIQNAAQKAYKVHYLVKALASADCFARSSLRQTTPARELGFDRFGTSAALFKQRLPERCRLASEPWSKLLEGLSGDELASHVRFPTATKALKLQYLGFSNQEFVAVAPWLFVPRLWRSWLFHFRMRLQRAIKSLETPSH